MAFTKRSDKESRDGTNAKGKHRDKSDLGAHFVAPDGRWGWVVCFAAGISSLSTFPVLQQFGLIFRDRFQELGMTNYEITSLINVHAAIGAMTGLLNGPIFRRFTFRQVAFFGSSLVFIGLTFASIANSFIMYLLTFSVLYGIGIGITLSSNSLALNTYFKMKRRYATGFSWTITSLGPIMMPYITTSLMPNYGVQGTVLILSAFALHAVACSLIYQPVQWHVRNNSIKCPEEIEKCEPEHFCAYCRTANRKSTGIFSSQYLYNDDDEETPGYEIIDPGTPMMSRANDGWFSTTADTKYGSKLSLISNKSISRKASSQNLMQQSKRLANVPTTRKDFQPHEKIEEVAFEDLESIQPVNNVRKLSQDNSTLPIVPNTNASDMNPSPRSRVNTFNREREGVKLTIGKYAKWEPSTSRCTCEEERNALKALQNLEEDQNTENEENKKSKYSLSRKIAIFFDLNLLKDFTYVNLMVGITIANFAEMNFSILTPFLLSDLGFEEYQIALAMSLLGAMDSGMRFVIPFVTEKIGWDNRTFFIIGVLGMASGRILIAHVRNFEVLLVASAWIGLNKALRVIFMALIIPGYVPLSRLPAASGLQLVFSGVFSLFIGPILGSIKDATNSTVTLHCINLFTYTTAICWALEAIYRRSRRPNMKGSPRT